MKKNTPTFIEWIIELLKDERGLTSIKPLVALIGTLFLCLSLIIDIISNSTIEISEPIVQSVMIITIFGMGGDTLDKFSLRKTDKNE